MRIAIVGAGIAGLTSAALLADAGYAVTVYERRTGFDEPGAGIQISPNASRILVGLGLGTALQRSGCTPDALAIRNWAGRSVARLELGRAIEERHGAPYLSVARHDLHAALLQAVRGRPGVVLRVGRSLEGIEPTHGGGLQLRFLTGSGTDKAECDLLVGADGLRSQVRAASGETRRPVFAGATALRAVVDAEAVRPVVAPTTTGLWLGPRRHFVHYPIRGGTAVNLVLIAEGGQIRDGWSTDVTGADAQAIAGRGGPALRALVALPAAWTAWSLFDLPVARGKPGPIVLVGDAAHPVLPYLAQGGAMAIEDAAVLAACLRRGTGDLAAVLRDFEGRRHARVRRVQAESRRTGRIYHLSGPGALLRDAAMRRLGEARLTGRLDWLYGWRPDLA